MPKIKDDNKIIAIHEATLKLVIKTGFNSLKMADVAKEAAIATGTLYIYYKSKEALINEVYLETKKEIVGILLHKKHQSTSFYNTFKNMWCAYFKYCLKQPEKMLFVEQFIFSGLIDATIIETTEALFIPLDQFLAHGQAQKDIKKFDIALMKAQIQGSLHEIIKHLIKVSKKRIDTKMSQGFDMAWNSIKL
jgi:AcrR family transcriptional regulator